MFIKILLWTIFACGWISAVIVFRAGLISVASDYGAWSAAVFGLLSGLGLVPLGFLFDARVARERAILDSLDDEPKQHFLDSVAKSLRERSGF